MHKSHLAVCLVVLIVGYGLGVYFPSVGKDVLSKVGL